MKLVIGRCGHEAFEFFKETTKQSIKIREGVHAWDGGVRPGGVKIRIRDLSSFLIV